MLARDVAGEPWPEAGSRARVAGEMRYPRLVVNLESIAYVLLGVVAAIWLIAMIAGMIAALPFGLLGLLAIVGLGFLFIKVLRERMTSREDDHYSKNVDK